MHFIVGLATVSEVLDMPTHLYEKNRNTYLVAPKVCLFIITNFRVLLKPLEQSAVLVKQAIEAMNKSKVLNTHRVGCSLFFVSDSRLAYL